MQKTPGARLYSANFAPAYVHLSLDLWHGPKRATKAYTMKLEEKKITLSFGCYNLKNSRI